MSTGMAMASKAAKNQELPSLLRETPAGSACFSGQQEVWLRVLSGVKMRLPFVKETPERFSACSLLFQACICYFKTPQIVKRFS
jgi:hypothetical protein